MKGSHHIYLNPESGRRVVAPVHKHDLPASTALSIQNKHGSCAARSMICDDLILPSSSLASYS
ncbi:MAG: type II toxin-antitoxin system HicA family toxin [Caldilinea sp.]